MPPRSCKGLNAKGEPCKAKPMRESDWCSAHNPDLPASARFGSVEQANAAAVLGGRPPKPTVTQVERELIEENIAVVVRPHFRTLGYDVIVDENGAHLVENANGGAKVYGESKDGEIRMSEHDDLGAMMTAADKLKDRVYGRPKQVQEVTGKDGAPVQLASTFDMSALSLEEKRNLLELMEKASGSSVA